MTGGVSGALVSVNVRHHSRLVASADMSHGDGRYPSPFELSFKSSACSFSVGLSHDRSAGNRNRGFITFLGRGWAVS